MDSDTDGDGIGDLIDVDDDNDGVYDCDERGLPSTADVSNLFELNGTAVKIGTKEVQLTSATNSQAGQMWSYSKVDFAKNFFFSFEANLGTNDGGADGIAIVFHNDPLGINAVGSTGIGIGARGIVNGLVLELDTFDNGTGAAVGDIAADHGMIWDTDMQSGAGLLTTAIALPNLENGVWKKVLVNWNASTKTLSYTVDGTLAGSLTNTNFTTAYFGGADKVFFGYTSSTGGFNNDQRVRYTDFCTELPITVDTDNDGIPNQLDLDSDGDGCSDSNEYYNNNTSAASGQQFGQTGGAIAPVNANGQVTLAAATYTGSYTNVINSGVATACVDYDGDGVSDSTDLDDDNDGILDTNEKGACGPGSIISLKGLKGVVYNSTAVLDAWTQINGSTTFPTSGFTQIATFDYVEFANTSNAFNVNFSASGNVSPTNIDMVNYQGTALNSPTREYAVMFSKTIDDNEVGTYRYSLNSGDNHVFIYKNGTKVAAKQNVFGIALPDTNFLTFSVVVGDKIDILLVEEDSGNTDINITTTKTSGQCMLDTDGDGIPNHLDTDSDNDGCNDVLEAGFTDADNNGTLGATPDTVNASGQITGDGGYTGTNANVTSAGTASTISTQPANQSVNGGGNATFNVVATGGSGTTNYQWQESTNNGTSWTNITNGGVYSGATTNTLSITGATVSMIGYDYRVVLTQSNFICANVISSSANLCVINIPTVSSTTQPTCAVTTGTIVFTTQTGVEYSIDNGTTYQASPTFAGLVPGTYTLQV